MRAPQPKAEVTPSTDEGGCFSHQALEGQRRTPEQGHKTSVAMSALPHATWFPNSAAATSYTSPHTSPSRPRPDPLRLHRQLPHYAQTHLVSLPLIAQEVGVGKVFIKDESSRLGLPAFKILGASFATFIAMCERYYLDSDAQTISSLRDRMSRDPKGPVTLHTATDGNHGRAVSRMASLLGAKASIVVPRNVTPVSIGLIASEGSEVEQIEGDYDAAVLRTIEKAEQAGEGHVVIQDSSWEGYEKVPLDISFGYTTLFAEVEEQLSAAGWASAPDLVILPVGVGSLAHSSTIFYSSPPRNHARILTVEPTTAACFLTSMLAGEMKTVETGETICPGLCCGTVSPLAWPDLRQRINASVAVDDASVVRAVEDLRKAGEGKVAAGPCGAATLAALRTLDTEEKRRHLGLNKDSVVVLISTEGDEVYRRNIEESAK